MMRTKKVFDCVEMMHHGALRIHELLKGKSKEEQLAYWSDRHKEAVDELHRAREEHAKQTNA